MAETGGLKEKLTPEKLKACLKGASKKVSFEFDVADKLEEADTSKAASVFKTGKSPVKGQPEPEAEQPLESGQSPEVVESKTLAGDESSLQGLASVNRNLWQNLVADIHYIKSHPVFQDIETASALDINDNPEEDSGFQDAFDQAKFQTAIRR